MTPIAVECWVKTQDHQANTMSGQNVPVIVVNKDEEHHYVDRRIKILNYLIELGDNDKREEEGYVDKKHLLKFLLEAELYRQEFGDDCVVPNLREHVKRSEEALGIQKKTSYRKDPAKWLLDGLKRPPTFRDNDNTKCREMFNEDGKHWVPIFDYSKREALAAAYCNCSKCRWNMRNGPHSCLSAPIPKQPKVNNNANRGKACTKHKCFLPHLERDDDIGGV